MNQTVYLALRGSEFNYVITPEGFKRLSNSATAFPNGSDWYYLVDTLEPFFKSCKLTILTVSPQMKFANDFSKSAATLHMPIWSWAEIEHLNNVCKARMTQDDLRHRFNILNGIPQKLFGQALLSPEDMVKNALENCDISYLITAPVSSESFENVAVRSTKDFKSFHATYASRYVSMCVYQKMKICAKKAMYAFVREAVDFSHAGSLRGTLYEHIANDILEAGGSFKRRKLEPKDKRTNAVTCKIPKSSTAVKDFNSIQVAYENEESLSKDTYFLPNDGFEAADSWKQEFGIFQHTVAETHDVKKLIHEIGLACKTKDLYFVIPDESTFRKFKYQKPSEPGPSVDAIELNQYALWVPVPDDI